jgi:hypothetical protein
MARDLQCPRSMKTIVHETASRRCLRVGLLLAGRLVEEKVLREGRDVTLGTGARCTFTVPSPGLPRRWRLFGWRGGRCRLHRMPAMHGKLALGESVAPLPPGGSTLLDPAMRGKVSIADLTVLFQLVTLPRLARPRLPPSIRGSMFTMIDRPFAMVLAACFVLQLAFVLQLRRLDWPRDVEHLTDDFKTVFVRRPLPPPPEALPGLATKPTKKTTDKKPTGGTPVHKPASRPSGDQHAQLVSDVHKMGILAVLTARGADGSSAIFDVLGRGGIDRAQEEALQGVNAVQFAGAESYLSARIGNGSGKVVDVRGLPAGGFGIAAADTGKREEHKVPRIQADRPVVDADSGGHLDANLLAREIRGRLGALRACYERSLKRNPSLAGKLLLRLTIAPAGTVSSVDLGSDSLDDPEMSACVRSSVQRWRFPPPEGGSLEVSFPFVFQPAV